MLDLNVALPFAKLRPRAALALARRMGSDASVSDGRGVKASEIRRPKEHKGRGSIICYVQSSIYIYIICIHVLFPEESSRWVGQPLVVVYFEKQEGKGLEWSRVYIGLNGFIQLTVGLK